MQNHDEHDENYDERMEEESDKPRDSNSKQMINQIPFQEIYIDKELNSLQREYESRQIFEIEEELSPRSHNQSNYGSYYVNYINQQKPPIKQQKVLQNQLQKKQNIGFQNNQQNLQNKLNKNYRQQDEIQQQFVPIISESHHDSSMMMESSNSSLISFSVLSEDTSFSSHNNGASFEYQILKFYILTKQAPDVLQSILVDLYLSSQSEHFLKIKILTGKEVSLTAAKIYLAVNQVKNRLHNIDLREKYLKKVEQSFRTSNVIEQTQLTKDLRLRKNFKNFHYFEETYMRDPDQDELELIHQKLTQKSSELKNVAGLSQNQKEKCAQVENCPDFVPQTSSTTHQAETATICTSQIINLLEKFSKISQQMLANIDPQMQYQYQIQLNQLEKEKKLYYQLVSSPNSETTKPSISPLSQN